ncbi:MAG: hypothetical protein C0621_07575 [Desulfuromonas sp.]|nr:MAG: hypothetical protein C0621_07575 [Desulfuromonas sp.]
MICGFCGRDIPEEDEKKGCTGCPVAGGCRKICCPWCGYENPAVPKFWQRFTTRKDDSKKDK